MKYRAKIIAVIILLALNACQTQNNFKTALPPPHPKKIAERTTTKQVVFVFVTFFMVGYAVGNVIKKK